MLLLFCRFIRQPDIRGTWLERYTDNLLYTDTRYNGKIRYNDNLTHETFAYEVTIIGHKLCKNVVFNTLKKHMF